MYKGLFENRKVRMQRRIVTWSLMLYSSIPLFFVFCSVLRKGCSPNYLSSCVDKEGCQGGIAYLYNWAEFPQEAIRDIYSLQ